MKTPQELIDMEIKYQSLTKDLNTPEVAREHAMQFLIKICVDSVSTAKHNGKCSCQVDIFNCNKEHVKFVRELFEKKNYFTKIIDFGSPHKYLDIDWNTF